MYIEHKALRWINDYRVKNGYPALKKLPRGTRRDPNGCVVHRALEDIHPDNKVYVDRFYPEGLFTDPTVRLPWYVILMILTFDMRLRYRQDANVHGFDELQFTTTNSKHVLTLMERLEMRRERKRVEKEMRAEREKARLEALAATLALRAQWEANYTDVWMNEHLKPAITDDLQALYEMEPYHKEEGVTVLT